jgi:hypothetical protein
MGLQNLLWVYYNNSPFNAVMDAYIGEIPIWKFRLPQGFWNGRQGQKNIRRALECFAKSKKIGQPKHCRNIQCVDFEEAGLSTLINAYFNGSPYLALKTLFPDLEPWQSSRVGVGYY